MESFWAGGCEAYLDAIREEFEERIQALEAERKATTDAAEIARITELLVEERRAYKRRVARADELLF